MVRSLPRLAALGCSCWFPKTLIGTPPSEKTKDVSAAVAAILLVSQGTEWQLKGRVRKTTVAFLKDEQIPVMAQAV